MTTKTNNGNNKSNGEGSGSIQRLSTAQRTVRLSAASVEMTIVYLVERVAALY